MQQFFVQCVSQKNVFASCTHSVTRYNLPCNLSREKNCVRSEISYDWLTIESVAKQVGRTMSHVVLLCDLKKKLKKKRKFCCTTGSYTLLSCMQLSTNFLQDKLHEKLLRVTAPFSSKARKPNTTVKWAIVFSHFPVNWLLPLIYILSMHMKV